MVSQQRTNGSETVVKWRKNPSRIHQEKRRNGGAWLTVTSGGRHAPPVKGVGVVPGLWLVKLSGKLTQSMRLFVWRKGCTRYKPPMTNTRTRPQMTMRGSTGPTPPYQKIHKKRNLLINPPPSREETSFYTCERRINLIKLLVILIIPDWNPRQRGRNHPPDWFLDYSFCSESLTTIHWYSIEYLIFTIPNTDI